MEIWSKQVLVKLFAIVFVILKIGLADKSEWHRGCVICNISQVDNNFKLEAAPTECFRFCSHQGFPYVGLQGIQCVCFQEYAGFLNVSDEQCFERCGRLPCGGGLALSIYSTFGPYIHQIQMKSASINQLNSKTLFEARIFLASDISEPTGLEDLNSTALTSVSYRWVLNGSDISSGDRVVTNNSAVVAFVHAFNQEGHYVIDLLVGNSVSQLNASTSITIVQPYPAILQVTLSPGQIDIPSCIPVNSGLTSSNPAVAVFVDQPTVFQASLVRGVNVSFIWRFGEDVVSAVSSKSCSGMACLEDQQVYTFREKGTFGVSVNATNYLGSISKTLNVVVSDKSISNLTVELARRSTVYQEVNSTVHFVVKLDTAARAMSTLEVNFGDSSSYNHSLRDVNDTFISGGIGNPSHLHLSASYGEGCRLLISLEHIYREEGVYQVVVAVSNNATTEGAVLEEKLEVLPRISHLNISKAAVYQTGEEFNVSVLNWEELSGATLHWCISKDDVVIFPQVANNSWATFMVGEAGRCTLNVSATNAISSASSQMVVVIQDPVEVSESFTIIGSVTLPGKQVKSSLPVLRGSNLSALWNFGDGTTELILVGNLTSLEVAHEYATVGEYSPFVEVWNLISEVRVNASKEIIVLDEIEDVTILSEGPTKFPSATVVEVTVGEGANISFTISYGQVMIHPETQLLMLGTYLLRFYIPHVGAQQVNLTAFNTISSFTREFLVLVLEDISTLSVDVIPRDTDSILLIKENGVIPKRSDLLYSWYEIKTGLTVESSLPTLLVRNSQVAGSMFNLTVSNQVSSKSMVVTVGVNPESGISLSHLLDVQVGQDVQFEVKVDETANISMKFGDGEETFSTNETTLTRTHRYTTPSVYAVSVLVTYANGREENTSSVIAVLEQIEDLQIVGPNVSTYSGPDSKQGWEVIPGHGSNIVYEWSIFPVGNPSATVSRTVAGGHTKTYLSFPSPGMYSLTVNASNSISSVQSSVTTLLQEPITSLVVSCNPTLITTNAEICVQVVGSTPLDIQMDFDDNMTENWSSDDERIQTGKPQLDIMTANLHMYTIVKNFTTVGEHRVNVTVGNKVSSQFRHHVVIVEDSVSGLVVTSDNSWLVNIQEQVVMYATVATGTDVIFEWDFNDPLGSTSEESNGTFSKATHFFGAPGEYEVSVSARNSVQSTPITSTYNTTFSVLEAIFGLELRVQDYSRNAPLVNHGDVWKTALIPFRAECWGSQVMFKFDFNDGTSVNISGTTNAYGSYFAIASHRFSQEGEFLVSVTASNLLSNLTATLVEPFLVQIAPTAIRFDKSFYVYRFGEIADLEVQLDVGSQVLFNWSMGDQTDYLNAPSRVEHMYHSEGVFTVTVVAFNSIQHSRTSCSVFIQNPIQGVEVLTDNHLVATRSKIELEARTFSGNPLWFYWDVGDNRKIQHSSVPVFSCSYLEAGIYPVTVVAGNHISNATSPPLTLTLVEPLSRVEIHDNGNVFLVGTETILVAITYSGSDVRYIWNFGDGSPEVDTHLPSVNHNYNGTGVYYVTLSGHNQISNKTVTTRIFIVNEMCDPPSLKLFGSENQMFRQSEDIRMEADVKIDCEVTNVADYKWTVNESQRALSYPLHSKMDYFGRRTMFIPRRVLDVGTYTVTLKVQMNGTIVFNTVTSSLRVVHSDLVSVIEGGTQRFFQQDDVVVMSGALSFDPDDPTSELSYNWKCLQLESTRPCFGHPGLSNTSILLPSGNQSLIFPVAWLLTNESDNFVFTLEVGKSGRVSVESFQVITIYQEKSVFDLSVDCPHCEGGVVNSNDLLTLEALCPHCDNGTTYEWSLYIVRDGKTGPSPSDSRCVPDSPSETNGGEAQKVTSPILPVTQPAESVSVNGQEILAGLTTQRQSTVNPLTVSSTNHGLVTTTVDPSVPSMVQTTERHTMNPTQGSQDDGYSYDYEVIESVDQGQDEGGTQVFPQSPAPTITEKMQVAADGSSVFEGLTSLYSDYYGEVWSSSSYYHDYVYQDDKTTTTSNPATAQSTKTGSEGVEPSLYEGGSLSEVGYDEYDIEESVNEFPESVVGGSDDPIDEDEDESENDPNHDSVRDDNTQPEIEEHLISKDRLKVPLTVDQTLTGLSGHSLTIKDGVLLEGRTYAVGLKITQQDGDKRQEGEVFQYFEVNEAPKLGTCSISPVAGQELDTFFIANCQEWQDTDLPLRFKISYSLSDSGPYTVLYFGMNYAAKFLLPAGYQANDYKVYLKLAIVDSKGGKRSVCDITIRVEPNYQLNGDEPPESIESYLYYLTVAPTNELSMLLDQGDSCSAHAFVRIVTHILNELENNYSDAVIQCDHYYHRCKIRRVLVEAIQMLPLRDSLEILQTSQALSAALAVTPEISVETLEAARSRLLNIVDLCFMVPKSELDLDVFYAVITSIAAVYDSQEKHFLAEEHWMTSKDLFYQTLEAESKIISLFTGMKLPNTSPLKHSSSLMDVTADQVNRLSSFKLTTKDVDVMFPSGIETVLWNISGTLEKPTNGEDCFNVGLVAYHMNPFHWGHDASRITTNIASAHVYSCEGERYNITSLPAGREVMFDIMNFCSEDTVSCNFTFDPNYMNVHQFNMTDDNIGQDLHILLTMRPTKNRAYPVNVLLRYDERPFPDEFDERWVYLEDSTLLDIFLPAGSLNDTGSYHLALVDGELGEIVYREDTDLLRPYSLTMWWGQCLSWSFREEEWTDKGCKVVPSPNHFVTQCKCNHVGVHGVSFLPVTSQLGQVHVSLLLVNPHNPIVYTVYTVVLGAYLLLFLYCFLTDRHDYDKPGLIFLKDNQLTDKQYYEVSFETGSRPGAGTSAKVSVVIRGDEGHSETKELICYEKPIFERNSRDRFIISVPESLGNITSILIWHDNGGITPGWYLSRVCVRDLLTGEKWFFICEQWFAAEEDDGKIERELKVETSGIGFQKAFFAKGAQYFSDYYIWSSVFTRPPYSIFTRVQRLTCCYAICMGFMCVNTLFYQTVDEKAINLSFIDISGEAVLVGIMTALVAIPINFPIIMLFRRAKPLRMPGEIGELHKYVRAFPDKEKDHDVMTNIPSEARWDAQLLDHTAERLRNLQNWARQKWKQKPKNLVIKEWRDDYILGEEITEETSFSSGFEDYNSSLKNNSTSTTPSKDKRRSWDGNSSADHKKLNQPKLWLPHAFYYLAWGGCIIVIVGSSVITLGLGHKFSYRKSLYWMQAVYFSFMQCFFITQPFVMAMFTVVKAWKHRNNIKLFDHYDDNTDLLDPCELEQERRRNYQLQFQNAIEARQRARYLRFARPPQAEELEKAKEKMQREKNMFAILRDIILFSTLAFCLLWIAYGKELAIHYPINNGIMDRFVRTPQPFTKVTSVDSLWQWIEGDLLDELFRDSWYNEQSWENALHGESFLLGKVSLRQVRVHQVTCSVPPHMKGFLDSCEPSYNKKSQSLEPFGPNNIWSHHSKQELLRYSKWGMFGSYEGNGFVVDLNNTRSSAKEQITTLQQNRWIDDKTRAVVIEFTLYNAPTNMFSSVALLAEMPGTGAVYPFPKIESVLLYRYQTAYDYFIMACEFVFLLLIAVSAKQEVQRAVKLKSKYLHDVWAWLEICTCVLSLTYFAMYVYRFAHVTEITRRLKATYMEEFVDMSFLAYWDQCLRDLIGWLVFIVSFKFLHLFRFNKMVAKFGVVVDSTLKEMLGFLAVYLALEVTFACFGTLLFGSHYYPMKNIFLSLEVVTVLMLGGVPNYAEIQTHYPFLWPLFHILYVIVIVIFFSGLMKAVLCHSYHKIKDTHKVEPVGGSEVLVFFWNRLLHQCGIHKLTEDESPVKLPLEFTLAEMEYQVEELLFRMNSVCDNYGISKLPDKDFESESSHDGRDDGISTCSAEENLCESNDEKYEEQFFNPEMRSYLQLNRESDDEDEKTFRDQLTMAIFHQLQQNQTKDSGQDTMSPSNMMEEDFSSSQTDPEDRTSSSRVTKTNGQIIFPAPVDNIGSLEEQCVERWPRLAWSDNSSQLSTLSSLEPYSSGPSSRSNNVTPDLNHDMLRNSHSEYDARSGWRGTGHPNPNDVVRDSEEEETAENTVSMDSFPLPNMLESICVSSSESETGHKKSSSRSQPRKLRKTKSRGKGKGRLTLTDDNSCISDDENVQVISFGPQT